MSAPPAATLTRQGPNVYVRPPRADDAVAFLRMTTASRRYHRPWVHPATTRAQYGAYVERYRSPQHAGFLVLSRADHQIVGVVHFNEIVRGLFQSAYLAYLGSRDHSGRGWMTEGVALALSIGFGPLRLHRVEANIQPGNTRSRALAERLGFRLEGYSPRYLKIGGRWRDHERWALLAEDWAARRKRSSPARSVRGRDPGRP